MPLSMKEKIGFFYSSHPHVFAIVVAAVLGFLTVLFSSHVSSFLFAKFAVSDVYNDAMLFAVLGKSLVAGKTPYLEVFDHKGLYIFYYTALGYGLGGRVGMFIVQFLVLSAFLYVVFEVCRELNFGWIKTVLVGFSFFALYSIFSQSPNDFEPEFPFIALSFLFYAKALKRQSEKHFMIGNIFVGVTAGLALNLRPSDAMVPFSIVVYYFVHELLDKEASASTKVKRILLNAGVVVASIVVVSIPPFIHAYSGGFLGTMVDVVILSNFRYIGNSAEKSIGTVWFWRIIVLFGVAALLLILYFCKKRISKDEFVFHLISIIVVGLVQFVIAYYPHYLIIAVPWMLLFVFRMAGLFAIPKIGNIIALALIAATGVASVALPISLYYGGQYAVDVAITTFVDDSIPEEDRNGHTLAYLCTASVYLNSNILPSFQDFAIQDNHHRLGRPSLSMEAMVEHLSSGECHYVILWNSETLHNEVYDFIIDGTDLEGNPGISKFAPIDGTGYDGAKYISIYQYIG